MEQRLKQMLLRPELTPSETQEAIREVCAGLREVQSRFAMESDSDLIEACIYEMEALRARYRYLLRIAKQEGLTAVTAPPFSREEGAG